MATCPACTLVSSDASEPSPNLELLHHPVSQPEGTVKPLNVQMGKLRSGERERLSKSVPEGAWWAGAQDSGLGIIVFSAWSTSRRWIDLTSWLKGHQGLKSHHPRSSAWSELLLDWALARQQ